MFCRCHPHGPDFGDAYRRYVYIARQLALVDARRRQGLLGEDFAGWDWLMLFALHSYCPRPFVTGSAHRGPQFNEALRDLAMFGMEETGQRRILSGIVIYEREIGRCNGGG